MQKKGKHISVLVVDDDKSVCLYLETALSFMGYKVESVKSGKDALERIKKAEFLVVILDIMMPEMDGITTLQEIRQLDRSLPVIMLSALGQTKMIVKAMKAGASDYVTKPFEDEELKITIEKVLEHRRLVEEVKSLKTELEEERNGHFVSASKQMAEIKGIIDKIAQMDVPVLITGESGVGKEIVARSIYSKSLRKDKAFLKVSCVALPGELLESELFGYEKGAFTGANVSKPGRFGLAHRGTIFLDEIGDLLHTLQSKLLQVLQDGTISRLGDTKETRVDVRILAATNRDLDKAIAEKKFREDLYHRLSVIKILIPPLRERKEDIPVLCDYFWKKYNQKYNRNMQPLSDGFINACMNYGWPGNVRELENVIRRVIVFNDETPILKEFALGWISPESKPAQASPNLKDAKSRMLQMENEMIMETLKGMKWNKKKTAEKLGVSYKVLLYKIKNIKKKDLEALERKGKKGSYIGK